MRARRRRAVIRSHKRGARSEAGRELWEVSPRHAPHVCEPHRSWSWPLRATRPRTIALLGMIRSGPLTSCSLAPRLRRASCPGSPTTALASTCRSPPPAADGAFCPAPAPASVHVFLVCPCVLCPANERWIPRPCVRTGPRLWYPGRVCWLKHRHHNLEWHQHGDAACLRRRRPAARGRLDPLGGAGQGDDPLRR